MPANKTDEIKINGKLMEPIERLHEISGFSLSHLRRLARTGVIPCYKIGRRMFFNIETVMSELTIPAKTCKTGVNPLD